MTRPGIRDWFYHRARYATGSRFPARPGQTVEVIGDARRAGKAIPALQSAFAAALLGDPAALDERA